ncbi:MAG: response regulator [Nitrospinae bacterium]|nr:response regulator [Nitrospinota bacterium]
MSFAEKQIKICDDLVLLGQSLLREMRNVLEGKVEGKENVLATHNEIIKRIEEFKTLISFEETYMEDAEEEEEEEEGETDEINEIFSVYMTHYTKLDSILSSASNNREKKRQFIDYQEDQFEQSWAKMVGELKEEELEEVDKTDQKVMQKFQFIELLAWIAIPTTLIILLLAYRWVLKGITEPIEEYIGITNKIAKDQYDFTLNNKQKDEIGNLSTALNDMARALQASKKDILDSKEFAEKANQAKSDFLSRMSHELRTPMNAILGFTQSIEMDSNNSLSEQHKENLASVISAGKHLLQLINDVLDISTIESGNLGISIDTVDIFPIVDNVISISKPMANKNSISLDYQTIPNGNCFAEVDPLRFKQIVLNLISNAIKYNKPNGSIIVSYEKQANDMMRIGIKDTGHGIHDDKKELVFKPFERVDIESQFIEGSGIGLTISKQLANLMKGSIGFDSVFGEGSFFYIDIPISDKIPLTIESEEEADIALQNDTNAKKILYVEDIPGNVSLVKQILNQRKPNIILISAPNALEGIKLAQSQTPDLILMDIHLPEIDGIEAFKRLQAIEKVKDIPVFALTADAMDADIKKAMKLGFKDYITKPINVPRFLEAIDTVLE